MIFILNGNDVKQYLAKYNYNNTKIGFCEHEINWAVGLAKHYTGEPIKIKNYIIANKEKIKTLKAENLKIKNFIESVKNDNWREFLKLRYIEGLSIEKIAEIMCYEYSSACILHGRILKRLAESF